MKAAIEYEPGLADRVRVSERRSLPARGILYRLMLKMDGLAAIEAGVRLRFASNIRLGQGSYLDQGVYLHAICQTPLIE